MQCVTIRYVDAAVGGSGQGGWAAHSHPPAFPLCLSCGGKLLLCGMQTGRLQAYPLRLEDPHLHSLRASWVLGVHDSQNGAVRAIRCSHDDRFVLTVGDDGNIFSFRLLAPWGGHGTPQYQETASPPPPLPRQKVAQDIEDPQAYRSVCFQLPLLACLGLSRPSTVV